MHFIDKSLLKGSSQEKFDFRNVLKKSLFSKKSTKIGVTRDKNVILQSSKPL
ncbi:hypothetical protein SAMN04488007_2078 [Maribacter aquivivus]|uniref:Uncharacterized protein n=1 Tax=Maribacter aquivivus TaxID=228958 RepID=A0A1M6NJI3_9FLAO|nr:hypothetical protein SAMN04488007_2078 [Maribacter aquivivus]